MTFWQFLSDNLWTLIIVSLFFGGSFVASINSIIKPILEHRLQIEQEQTKQARLDRLSSSRQENDRI